MASSRTTNNDLIISLLGFLIQKSFGGRGGGGGIGRGVVVEMIGEEEEKEEGE